MNISHLRVGIIHSLIGKNDGVSIVIDQTVLAMVKDLGIDLGNIFFLCAHSSPRFNSETNDIFWHKNTIHQKIIKYFNEDPAHCQAVKRMGTIIEKRAIVAKDVIAEFVQRNEIDLIIAHNTSHPYNFVTAVGLGYYIEELRSQGIIWPKLLVWWHDSYFERDRFNDPNEVIKRYLKYLPGSFVDGIAFINKTQIALGRRLFENLAPDTAETFFNERTCVVPNTSDIPWDWKTHHWNGNHLIAPPKDNYNTRFFTDVGLTDAVEKLGFTFKETVVLLQHTRVVPRKKIEVALDFAFELEKRYRLNGLKKCVALLVSGHSGDEQEAYKEFLIHYYQRKCRHHPESRVAFVFGENKILSHRDIIVDKKYYKFAEVPAIVAAVGGMGTYFSEVEGFGNNLLEMISHGLPVVINKYEVYKTDIEHLGFDLPAVDECILRPEVIDRAFILLTNLRKRNATIHHNLRILHEKLDHRIIADQLRPLIHNMFTKVLVKKR